MDAPRPLTAKERMAIERQKMPEQEALRRSGNFEEVNLGLPEQFAMLEAQRCLKCKNAHCVQGCPVMVNIPRFINFLAEGNIKAAAESLLSDNALPAVTGRVCPQETQCEANCIRGNRGLPVAIGYLERFVADWARGARGQLVDEVAPPTGKKCAVVGSGPGGLTAAGELSDAITQAVQSVSGKTPELSTTGGTSDGRFIATICPQVIEFGPVGKTIHQINECVAVADLQPLADVYAGVLKQLVA